MAGTTLFDAHNHVHKLLQDSGLEHALAKATNANVTKMNVCATGAEGDWTLLQKASEKYPGHVVPSFGIHPWHIHAAPIGWKKLLERTLDSTNANIGEIGLDKSARSNSPIEDQLKAFRWQMDMARERELCATVHCVKAWGCMMDELRQMKYRKVILHGGVPNAEIAQQLSLLGVSVSLGSTVTDPRIRAKVTEILQAIPQELLLIETDSPDGWRNYEERGPHDSTPQDGPAKLPIVCNTIAKILEKPVEQIAETTFINASKLFY